METRLRVLLVEDDEVDRAFVRSALGDHVELTEAGDLKSAFGALQGGYFDCILCDLGLPDGDGVQIVRHARAQRTAQPAVVVLTGRDDDAAALTTMQSGAQDYLVKGRFGRRLLLRTLRYAIERQRITEVERQMRENDRLSTIGQLTAGVAHEINTPATVLLNNLEVLGALLHEIERAVEDGDAFGAKDALTEARDIVKDDLAAVRRIASTVADLRAYAAPRAELRERVHLNELVQTACNIAGPQLRCAARLELELGDVPAFDGDPGRLMQAFVHLLVNAARAVTEAGRGVHVVSVQTWSDGRFAWCAVSDTGVGIATLAQKRVFDPFYTTRDPDRGSGMGLAVAAEAVRRHEGSISVVSSPGAGARFEVRIPLDPVDARPTGVPSIGTPAPTLRRLRVLVIDDERSICRAFERLLRADYDVSTANGGRYAIDLLRRDQAFDVVLCDVMMPGVDGCGVHAWMCEHAPHLVDRTIFCTAGAFSAEAQTFLSTVPNPCLNKPIELDDLRRLLVMSDVMGSA